MKRRLLGISSVLLLALLALSPVLPWRNARLTFGVVPLSSGAPSSEYRGLGFEYRNIRDAPNPRITFGFEMGRIKLVLADVVPVPTGNGARDCNVFSIGGRPLLMYVVRHHAPWTAPSTGPVRWRMWFIDSTILAILIGLVPLGLALRRLRRGSPRVRRFIRWGLIFAPCVVSVCLWLSSDIRPYQQILCLYHSSPNGVELWDAAGRIFLQYGSPNRNISAPYWQVVLVSMSPLLLTVPAIWRGRRRAHRRSLGLCEICGYDLRASVNQCPECGAVIETAVPSA